MGSCQLRSKERKEKEKKKIAREKKRLENPHVSSFDQHTDHIIQ
jgi:hypothetical protein